jgi:septum formation inhibitor MinC
MARLAFAGALMLLLASPAAAAGKASDGSGSEEALKAKALSVAGVQKVIAMLTDMQAKAKQEKNDEQVKYSNFDEWCKNEKASLTAEIKKNGDTIELLTTEIEKLESDVKMLAEAIAKLQETIASNQADQKANKEERAKAHAEFLDEQKDYEETLSAIDRAIDVLAKQDYDRPATAAVLLQLAEQKRLPKKVADVVNAMVQMLDSPMDDPMNYNQPEANAYEFQSGGIIATLKRLKDQFRMQLSTTQKEEMNSEHAFDMVMLELKDTEANYQKDAEEKTAEKERKAEMAAENKKQLASTKDIKAANEHSLAETTTECDEKGMSFEEKQDLRTEEIEAIGKALEILSSPEVSGNAEKYLELVQQGKAKPMNSFVQAALSSHSESGSSPRRRVREFLAGEGQRLHSKRLALLAEQLSTDPFAKVKGLIDGMITRLEEEAFADAQHEGYCDTEMGKSKITRTRLTEEIDALDAAIEDGKATITALAESTKTLSAEVADLEKAMTEATALRKSEKATNEQTVEDAKAAQKAVEAATAVLKDFYDKALSATALLQGKHAAGMQQRSATLAKGYGLKKLIKMGSEEWAALANPNYGGYDASADTGVHAGRVDTGHKAGMQTFGANYKGMQEESDFGIFPMLEIIHSDFANLQADTEAAEAASLKAFEDFMIDSKKNKAMKDRKIEMNNDDQASAEVKLRQDIADLKATQDELLAAERYHANLVPQCIDKGMTFDERTAAREEEIASLKQALTILNMSDIETSA